MAGETLSEALEREHREVDQGTERFMSSPRDDSQVAALAQAIEQLRRHIYVEEEFLFPPLGKGGMVAPLFVMVREHAEIWRVLDRLAAGLSNRTDPASTLTACHDLMVRLGSHNSKEEPIVYAQANSLLSEPEVTRIRERLETAQMPEGWVCQGVRART
ncbi:MAG: hemerythrin domain-containing protein [Acidimicrobiales bacterium]